jgi:glycogen debranching enzyme
MDDYLAQLSDHLGIDQVSFTFPGSRILLFQYPEKSRLYIKLAERLINTFPGLEEYLTRDPFISDFQLFHGDGKPIEFLAKTYPHFVNLETSMGLFQIAFEDQDTFHFSLPKKANIGLKFKVHANRYERMNSGGFAFAYRNLKYETDAEILAQTFTHVNDVLEIEVLFKTGNDNSIRFCVYDTGLIEQPIAPFSSVIESSGKTWRDWFDRIPEVNVKYKEKYLYAWWVMAANQISPKGNITKHMAVPSKCGYIGAWLWDNALHTLAYRYVDPQLARDQIQGMLVHQLEDGMLPDAIFDDGIVTEISHPIKGRVTKPPILAWAAMKIYEIDPDKQFIRDIYDPLVRWNHWWLPDWKENPGALASYSHPYSSGMDDHPTWEVGMPVVSPDLNTYLYLQMAALSEMAAIIGKNDEAKEWESRSERLLKAMIGELWDEEAGLFWAYHNGEPIKTKSIINLFPIWTGRLPSEMNQRLLEHMKSDSEFGGDYVLPVVSRDDFEFSPDKMWRGPIWANMNYFFIEALIKIGQNEFAGSLREKTLKLILENEGIYEYYNAVTGSPGHHAVPMFSWTASVFIDLAIQAAKEERSDNAKN